MASKIESAAREVAEMADEGMTQTVAGRLLEIGRVSSERMSTELHDVDHGELLYEPDGLP